MLSWLFRGEGAGDELMAGPFLFLRGLVSHPPGHKAPVRWCVRVNSIFHVRSCGFVGPEPRLFLSAWAGPTD